MPWHPRFDSHSVIDPIYYQMGKYVEGRSRQKLLMSALLEASMTFVDTTDFQNRRPHTHGRAIIRFCGVFYFDQLFELNVTSPQSNLRPIVDVFRCF